MNDSPDTDETRREFLQAAGAVTAAAAVGGAATADDAKSKGLPTRPLGKTGVNVSIIALGGWHVAYVEKRPGAGPPTSWSDAATLPAHATALGKVLLAFGPREAVASVQQVLAVHTSYYEFVPEDAIDAPSPRTLLAHELINGGRYYVLLTGANGLYRYDLNDVVEVRGFWDRTPKLAFVRKGRDMLNITGEKLHLNHVLHAVRAAERATGLAVWQFRLIPDVEAARYDLLLESPRTVGATPALADFAVAVDGALSAVNCEYQAKRASGRLGPLRLFVMRAGWSERRCQREFHSRARSKLARPLSTSSFQNGRCWRKS